MSREIKVEVFRSGKFFAWRVVDADRHVLKQGREKTRWEAESKAYNYRAEIYSRVSYSQDI